MKGLMSARSKSEATFLQKTGPYLVMMTSALFPAKIQTADWKGSSRLRRELLGVAL